MPDAKTPVARRAILQWFSSTAAQELSPELLEAALRELLGQQPPPSGDAVPRRFLL
jgi:flagellar basal body-associated protein FliL